MDEQNRVFSPLDEALRQYGQSDYYPFHMPGHKRRMLEFPAPFSVDITEIEGFDNLHHACGCIKAAQARAAELFGAEETFFLVNGSTGGLLSAVSACVPRGGRLLMARNCHKAVYHAAYLRALETVYLYPGSGPFGINGGIAPEDVEAALEKDNGIKAVLITSPTYDGVVSDVKRIAAIAHAHGVPLIVDEAHGAHFGLCPDFPERAVSLGADVVIQSVHKTLPCPTQTSLLHVSGSLADRDALRRFLGIYQTSSPSYLFMAAIDRMVGLLSREGEGLFADFVRRLEAFRSQAGGLRHIRLVDGTLLFGSGAVGFDRSKLILAPEEGQSAGMDGRWLGGVLRERYHLEMEMESPLYCLGIATVADTDEGFGRLARALAEIDKEMEERGQRGGDGGTATEQASLQRPGDVRMAGGAAERSALQRPGDVRMAGGAAGRSASQRPTAVRTISEAADGPRETVALEDSAGRVSAEFAYLYPPGIPLIVPGERIEGATIRQIQDWQRRGYELQGTADYTCRTLGVCRE